MGSISMERLARREDRRLLTGAAAFVGDVQREGQLWLSVVRSSVAHGRLLGIDTGAASQLPGVVAVLSGHDLASVSVIPIRVVSCPSMVDRLQPVIATERVRYVGEPIAVVVAEDPYIAEDAADLVFPDIDPLPAVVDAWGSPSESLWDLPGGNKLAAFRAVDGDVDAAFATAATVVEAELSVQRHTAVPMETRGLVAEWEGDQLHLWGPTKFLHFTRRTVASFFGVPADDVICHQVDVGGMFGVRGEVYPEDFLVPWAARVTGRPVKWVEDRREHFLSINHSREHRQRVAVAVAADGELLGLRSEGVLDLGAYPRPIGGRMIQIAAETMPGPYRWRGFDIDMRGSATNKTPVGTMRGPVSYETTFVRERVLDLVAAQIGMDPLELRRRNLITSDAIPFTRTLGPDLHDQVYDTGDYLELVRTVAERCDLDGLRASVARRRGEGELVGVGAALFLDHSGLGVEESVQLRLQPDGRFVLATSAAENGQGLASMAAMVTADALDVRPEDVDVLHGDSRAHHGGRGTFASRSTIFVGSAATDAARRLREAALQRAADMLRVPLAGVSSGPEGFSAGSDTLHWKDVAPLEVEGAHRMEDPTYGFGMHVAVASVDPDTAEVRVEQLVVGYDVGRAIDPPSVVEQLRGAAVMGLGGALLEELAYDESGQPITTTFIDYLLPTSAEVPDVDVYLLEQARAPGNPLGAKGAGEAGIFGVGAAVANAVADALGSGAKHALLALPLKPDAVLPLLPADSVLDAALAPAPPAAADRQPGPSALPPVVAPGREPGARRWSDPLVAASGLLAVLAVLLWWWMKERRP